MPLRLVNSSHKGRSLRKGSVRNESIASREANRLGICLANRQFLKHLRRFISL